MSYNPLYGSVPYLAGGNRIQYGRFGIGLKPILTLIENAGTNVTDKRITNLKDAAQITDEELESYLNGDVKGISLATRRGAWLPTKVIANLVALNEIKRLNKKLQSEPEGGGTGDSGIEELEGDDGEQEYEPEPEPGPGPSGPVEAEMPQEEQQQNPDFGQWQDLYDKINQILNSQQNPEPEPEPEPGVTREDLLGMNRQNRRDFRHGRETRLDNGMRVAPTSRFAGRKIAHAVGRNNRQERRQANRNDRNAFRTGILNEPGILYADQQDYDKIIPR